MEGTASTGELAMMAGMALTPIEMARAGGVRGRLGYSGGVVAEAGASLNGEATEREAWARRRC